MSRIVTVSALFALFLLVAIPGVSAGEDPGALVQAKAAGLLGEKPDGLVAIVSPPGSSETQTLAASVNAGRMESYQAIAKERNLDVKSVQSLAGSALIAKSPPGTYVQAADGRWTRK